MENEKTISWLYADIDELIDFDYEEEPICPNQEARN